MRDGGEREKEQGGEMEDRRRRKSLGCLVSG